MMHNDNNTEAGNRGKIMILLNFFLLRGLDLNPNFLPKPYILFETFRRQRFLALWLIIPILNQFRTILKCAYSQQTYLSRHHFF